MQPNQTPDQSPMYKNPLSAMADGEQMIFAVKRHPFGLIGMYIAFGLLLIIVAVVAFIAPDILSDDFDSTMVSNISIAAFVISAVLVVLFSFIAHIVYYGNQWILTSDSLTQISQNSLFNKQNSQLSLGNLEDISAHQDGILAHMFNFGLLKVETAGEHSKFAFIYCPKPNEHAQQILMAREAFERNEQYSGQKPNITTSS